MSEKFNCNQKLDPDNLKSRTACSLFGYCLGLQRLSEAIEQCWQGNVSVGTVEEKMEDIKNNGCPPRSIKSGEEMSTTLYSALKDRK